MNEKERALIEGLLRSGMRETACALCGRQLWNREPMDPSVCPPCQHGPSWTFGVIESGNTADPIDVPLVLKVNGPCACGWEIPERIEVQTPETEPVPSAFRIVLVCPRCQRVYQLELR